MSSIFCVLCGGLLFMTARVANQLTLEVLKAGMPGVTRPQAETHIEACMVCFKDRSHETGVAIALSGVPGNIALPVVWVGDVTRQVMRGHGDLQDATENGACAIAFLLIREFTEYTVVERTWKGPGFDYWTGFEDEGEDEVIYCARLEVSGIKHSPDQAYYQRRIREKIEQTKVSDHLGYPAYVVVVDFGQPKAHMELR